MSRSPLLSLIAHWLRLPPVKRCMPDGRNAISWRKPSMSSIVSTIRLYLNAAWWPSSALARRESLNSLSSLCLSQRIFILVTCAVFRFGGDRTRICSRSCRIHASSQICCKTRGDVSHFAAEATAAPRWVMWRYNWRYAFRSHIRGRRRPVRHCTRCIGVWHRRAWYSRAYRYGGPYCCGGAVHGNEHIW